MKAWKELTETWLQTPFTEIDAAVLEKHVTLYQRTCHQAVKGLPSNPVAKRLKVRMNGRCTGRGVRVMLAQREVHQAESVKLLGVRPQKMPGGGRGPRERGRG